jgi:hypothetical protein
MSATALDAADATDAAASAGAGVASSRPLWDDLHLEAHGFVSFGHLRTWDNNVYTNDTRDGTDEFYEAALNVVARPWDRLRLGAQVFVRDFGRYDNGRAELDWGYAELSLQSWCTVQAGRVKIPVGLYNEIQDIDAARTPVFLAQSLYPTRLRELLVSIDGGKLNGRADLNAGGALSYTAFGGTKHFADDGAYAVYVGETARLAVDDIEVGAVYGGMVQWDTPVEDLALRFTAYHSDDIAVSGTGTGGRTRFVTDSRSLAGSLLWEPHDWTFAVEYLNITTDGTVTTATSTRPYEFWYDGGYASATWHATTWLEGYVAAEYRASTVAGRPTAKGWSWIAAVKLMPLPNWSLKAEYQYQDNTVAVLGVDNPGGVSPDWHLLALKTTVDF